MSQPPAFWHQPNLLAKCLSPLSQLYWLVAQKRLARHQPFRLSVPVICVGNNTVGGAGKTPTVLACAALLQKAGHKPAVISRGYKGRFEGVLRVDTAKHTAEQVGDEPLLIASRVACYVARKRLAAARAAIAEGADCIIMDDGMQNPSLHKDLTIMVVDGGYGFGNGTMLPAGPCREPIAISLAKADMILVMGAPSQPDASALFSQLPQVFQAHLKAKTELPFAPLFAFSGIARPAKFFDMLQQMGATLVGTESFADHHFFTQNELQNLAQNAAQHNAKLITTEKDWLRLGQDWREQVGYVAVLAQIDNDAAFAKQLLGVFESVKK